jgi:phosphate starvation-inducible PhoH-like protein
MSRRRQKDRTNKPNSGFNPKGVTARSDNQKAYIQAILSNDITFCQGPAGTGKTHVAVGIASGLLRKSTVERIVVTRPVVEVGNSIGYLPGTMEEKVGPYLTPLFDELGHFIERTKLKAFVEEKIVEISPLSMMRGRTFTNAVVICDEAQNANTVELKMLLTRLGEGSKIIVTGDLSQSDLPVSAQGAFSRCMDRLHDIEGIAIVEMTADDIVRHHLINIIKERLG